MQKNAKNGFTLIEVAIVLGVFGLIAASLWSMVSSTNENTKREQTNTLVSILVDDVRTFFMNRPNTIIAGAGTCPLFTTALLQSGVVSSDMVRDRSASPLLLDHAWGPLGPHGAALGSGGIVLCPNINAATAIDATTLDTNGQLFSIRFSGIPYGACQAVGQRLSGGGAPSGLVKVYVNGTAYDQATNGFPVRPDWLSANCKADHLTAGNQNQLDLVYRLRNQRM